MREPSYHLTQLGVSYLKRLAIIWAVVVLVGFLVLYFTWYTFFTYVPPGKHLVIMAKDGTPMRPDQVLAEPGQKGIQREVLGEGWHFVLPIAYATELEDNTIIPAGKVGLVTARGGTALPPGVLLAEEGQRGIQRHVLPPGVYRINKHGYDVEIVNAVQIKPGYVGVQQRLLGTPGKTQFAEKPGEQGILREVLQPGLYYVNTKEFNVIPVQVGIYQTSYLAAENSGLTFTSKGFEMSMDCTIEWEVLPEDMPVLVAAYGENDLRRSVEKKLIDIEAHQICQDKGLDYSIEDFLEGSKREKFQHDFSQELTRRCRERNLTVHSAFIRNINIPPDYMKQVADKQIAEETRVTNAVREATALSDAGVEREERLIEQKVKEVQAETARLVAGIDIEVKNLQTNTDAEIEKIKAEYQAKMAELKAEQIRILGAAKNDVAKLKETATNNLYQLKREIFQNDADAFLRYALAEQLNPKLMLRLYHSGPGTLWTNMESKGMDFMLPVPAGPASPSKAADKTAASANGK